MFDKGLVGRLYQEAGILVPGQVGLINHMMGAGFVAEVYALGLSRRGQQVNVELVANSARLHDIGKPSNGTLWGHVDAGVKFLRERGVDEAIVQLVGTHQAWKTEIPVDLLSWDERLVIIGDLSFRDRIMPAQERIEDIIERYGGKPDGVSREQERWIRQLAKGILQKISEHMPLLS